MKEYWGHTLQAEEAVHHTTAGEKTFRIDMHDCPSKGSLIRNGLDRYCDYCDHCMGWIGLLLNRARFMVDHQHNHRGQCWWEIHRESDIATASSPANLLETKMCDYVKIGMWPRNRWTPTPGPTIPTTRNRLCRISGSSNAKAEAGEQPISRHPRIRICLESERAKQRNEALLESPKHPLGW